MWGKHLDIACFQDLHITHHQNVLESQEIKTFFVAPKTMALSEMKLKTGTGVQSNFCQRVSGILYSSLPNFFKLWKFIGMVHKVSQALSECLFRLMNGMISSIFQNGHWIILIWTLFGHPGFSQRPFQVELGMS